MNNQATIAAPTAVRAWTFEVGQAVDHVDAGAPAIVTARHWTGKREVYGLRFTGDFCRGEQRVMEGASLVSLGCGGAK